MINEETMPRRDKILNLIQVCLDKEDSIRRFYYFIFIYEQLEDTEINQISDITKLRQDIKECLLNYEKQMKYKLMQTIMLNPDEGRVLLNPKWQDKEIYNLETYEKLIKQILVLDYEIHIILGKVLKLINVERSITAGF